MERAWRKEAVADVLNVALGVLLFLTPWMIVGYAAQAAAIWNAWLSGIAIAGLALAALSAYSDWEEWLNVAAGLWVVASPWLVGFSANAAAAHVHVMVGVIVALMAAVGLWFAYRAPARYRASRLRREPTHRPFPISSQNGGST